MGSLSAPIDAWAAASACSAVEVLAVPEMLQIETHLLDGRILPERDQAFEGKDRVVEVALAGAVAGAAVFVELVAQKPGDGLSGFLKEVGRQPRDLQHFEPQT